MPRFAAIDIGTNSTKMTVADVSRGAVTSVAERSEITRLGKGVDATHRLSDESMRATLDAINRFVAEARELGATKIRAGGTSAMRDADNGKEFVLEASQIIGSEVEVISGDREAQLSFAGATSDGRVVGNSSDGGLLAFDVGGGSTELIIGKPGRMERFRSLNIGAVRTTERVIASDPPSPAETEAAIALIRQDMAAFEAGNVARIIGIGGTATTAATMLYPDANDVQACVVTSEHLDDLLAKLSAMTLDERRTVPGLDPKRADVIIAGILIIREILRRFDKSEFMLSLRGVRFGLLLEMAADA